MIHSAILKTIKSGILGAFHRGHSMFCSFDFSSGDKSTHQLQMLTHIIGNLKNLLVCGFDATIPPQSVAMKTFIYREFYLFVFRHSRQEDTTPQGPRQG